MSRQITRIPRLASRSACRRQIALEVSIECSSRTAGPSCGPPTFALRTWSPLTANVRAVNPGQGADTTRLSVNVDTHFVQGFAGYPPAVERGWKAAVYGDLQKHLAQFFYRDAVVDGTPDMGL